LRAVINLRSQVDHRACLESTGMSKLFYSNGLGKVSWLIGVEAPADS